MFFWRNFNNLWKLLQLSWVYRAAVQCLFEIFICTYEFFMMTAAESKKGRPKENSSTWKVESERFCRLFSTTTHTQDMWRCFECSFKPFPSTSDIYLIYFLCISISNRRTVCRVAQLWDRCPATRHNNTRSPEQFNQGKTKRKKSHI